MLNAMNQQSQLQLTQINLGGANDDQSQSLLTDCQQATADYVSNVRAPDLNIHMTDDQRKLVEKVVNYKQFEYPKSLFFLGPISLGSSLVGMLGLISSVLDSGLNHQFSLIGGSIFMALGIGSGAIASAITIKAAINRSKATKLYKQYLQDGHDLALEPIAQSISDVLKKGFKGQPLCSRECAECLKQRNNCSKCCQADSQNANNHHWEQKICRSCWKNVCRNCATCKIMRIDTILDYVQNWIIKELNVNISSDQLDIEMIINYMNELLEKQSDAAQTIV